MSARVASAVLATLALSGCGLSMTEQRKYTTYEPSTFWDDGASARPLPEGVVDQEAALREAALAQPPKISPDIMTRGRERFEIFCAPCHGLAGDGDGVIVKRGFPSPPSYHSQELVGAPAQHFVDVITSGHGVMYSYADRVEPADRWAIAAYIRALQLSRLPAAASLLRQGEQR
ncbi:MAG: c-type cytochrome [Methylocystis sp.]|jgi:mono/diheme cytochrome c family protein